MQERSHTMRTTASDITDATGLKNNRSFTYAAYFEPLST